VNLPVLLLIEEDPRSRLRLMGMLRGLCEPVSPHAEEALVRAVRRLRPHWALVSAGRARLEESQHTARILATEGPQAPRLIFFDRWDRLGAEADRLHQHGSWSAYLGGWPADAAAGSAWFQAVLAGAGPCAHLEAEQGFWRRLFGQR
jgi:hypothetical protein